MIILFQKFGFKRILPSDIFNLYSSIAAFTSFMAYSFLILLLNKVFKRLLTVSNYSFLSPAFKLSNHLINTNPSNLLLPHRTCTPFIPDISFPLRLPYTIKVLFYGIALKTFPAKSPPTHSKQALHSNCSAKVFSYFSKFSS